MDTCVLDWEQTQNEAAIDIDAYRASRHCTSLRILLARTAQARVLIKVLGPRGHGLVDVVDPRLRQLLGLLGDLERAISKVVGICAMKRKKNSVRNEASSKNRQRNGFKLRARNTVRWCANNSTIDT